MCRRSRANVETSVGFFLASISDAYRSSGVQGSHTTEKGEWYEDGTGSLAGGSRNWGLRLGSMERLRVRTPLLRRSMTAARACAPIGPVRWAKQSAPALTVTCGGNWCSPFERKQRLSRFQVSGELCIALLTMEVTAGLQGSLSHLDCLNLSPSTWITSILGGLKNTIISYELPCLIVLLLFCYMTTPTPVRFANAHFFSLCGK